MSRHDGIIVITYNGTDHSYVPTNEEINTCLLDKRRVFKHIGASLDEAVELKIDFNPVLKSVTDGSFTAHQFHGFGNVIEDPIPRFEDYESFLSFLESIKSNPYDTAPTLRSYITRLYYHNDMPVLNKGDLIGGCNRSCTVLSESNTAKYIDKLIDIGFLVLTSEKPTKIFQVDCLDGSSLYLNADFYNPDRFAMGAPSVAHAGENKEVKLSTGQTWTHKQKGYDVKIDYINRTGDVVVEEVATGQRDGFGRKAFLERFSPKSKEGDA